MTENATKILAADADGIAAAAACLRRGALVAFPTETVYGLGADATRTDAVAAIYAAKGRPAKNPLIVHVPDLEAALALVDLSPDGFALAQAFWPGPLTLVARLRDPALVAPAVTAGHPTVAIRVPAHQTAQALLRAAGIPLAAPSANRSGRVSPTTAAHVVEELSGRIEAVIDAGPCEVGLESTIIGVDGAPTLLRPGGLPTAATEACLGKPLTQAKTVMEAPTAPGLLASHYAPRAMLRLNAQEARDGEVLLGFGEVADADLNLSPSGDLAEAATNLFAMLRALDAAGASRIAVSAVPRNGLGLAINDRLERAAAPRD